jgi:malate synthase
MEDAATAEISRCQIWQWINRPKGVLDDGRRVTLEMVRGLMDEEMSKIRDAVGAEAFEAGHYQLAAKLFGDIIAAEQLPDFLTLVAYEYLD